MNELVVISGKGGTGKTSLVASFAALAKNATLADCDVDAADLHIILKPNIKRQEEFSGGVYAKIKPALCENCAVCYDVCRYNAVIEPPRAKSGDSDDAKYSIDQYACEGCGVCEHFCPHDAIELIAPINGHWYISDTRFGTMVHAKLGIGEENSGKLVAVVKKEGLAIAKDKGSAFFIVDGPPGIGCPVISSLSGASFALIVTEPTVSGEHDFLRAEALARHFNIPTAICVNKFDLNTEFTENMEKSAKEKGIFIAGRIRFDKSVTAAQIQGLALVEHTQKGVAEDIINVWNNVAAQMLKISE